MFNRNNLLFTLLKFKSKIFCILPRSLSLAIGRMIGSFLYYCIPLRKKIALINLKIAFPKKSNYEINQILKKCYVHFGMLISDFLRLPKLNEKNIHKLVELDSKTKQLLKENNPSMIMTAHIGNWELFLSVFGYNNYRVSGVAKTQKNKAGDRFFNWIRACNNTLIISSTGNPIKELSQALNKGYHLILISDQNAREKGTENKLFNAITSTPKGAAIFNIKNNTPLIFITIIMNRDYSYSLYSQKLNPIFKDNSNNQKVIDINDAYNKELENSIINYPEQYFWFHKKWDRKYYQ